MFGYNKGAFTGANKDKPGKFEEGNGGTIFLDEIGNLPVNIQNKLLRVLQEREITRLGSRKSITVDVRIIAATNLNIESAVKKGFFREDLYHRINAFPIVVPPLREREDDVILFSKYFMDKFSVELNKKVKSIDNEVLNIFKKYNWPGNVRELENVIKSAIILADENGSIMPEHIPENIRNYPKYDIGSKESPVCLGKTETSDLLQVTKSAEKELIIKTLKETNWNQSEASRRLKISYKTLYNKIKKYGIKR